MFSKINSIGLKGLDGYPVSVEVDAGDGLPGVTMVGALAPEVREAQDRVRTAIKNSGYHVRPRKVTVNLSPADVRKNGTGFDLPIAMGMLCAYGMADAGKLEGAALVGELGLDGELKPVRGILSLVLEAKAQGWNRCFLPRENVREGQAIGGIEIIGISSLREMAEYMRDPDSIEGQEETWEEGGEDREDYPVDYREVQGQVLMKRAAEVAAAGCHNLLYIGPAGTGKSMVAERIPTIMPSCTRKERLEMSKVYSICGLLPQSGALLSRRPFRSPHHSITGAALVGGGRNPMPGELSLASGGVLFLDEFPEFSKHVIEMLRQPLESRKVVLSRVSGKYEFPARFILVAAMNVETVILIQAAYDKKTEMPQNQGILLIFFVIKVTIKDNWSYFQIKKKGESAPVFNDRKVIVIKMYLSLQGKISIGVAVTSTKQYIFAIRRGPKYKI